MTVPLYNLTDTWNNGATVFTAILMNVTDSASDATSMLMDLQVGSASKFGVDKLGNIHLKASQFGGALTGNLIPDSTAAGYGLSLIGSLLIASQGFYNSGLGTIYLGYGQVSGASVMVSQFGSFSFSPNLYIKDNDTPDINLFRDAAGILAQRNSTNAQTLRVYNTFTDSSNYERGIFDWNNTANTLTIGTEAAGTGTARDTVLKSAGNVVLQSAGGSSVIDFNTGSGGAGVFARLQSSFHLGPTGAVIAWSSTGTVTVGEDLGISRSAAGVLAIGNGTAGDGSSTILAKTKAGAPTTGDVPAGTWALIRDTTNLTTKFYYNNAGALQSVALT